MYDHFDPGFANDKLKLRVGKKKKIFNTRIVNTIYL